MNLKELIWSDKSGVCKLLDIQEPALRVRMKKNNWTVKDCRMLSDHFNIPFEKVVDKVLRWEGIGE